MTIETRHQADIESLKRRYGVLWNNTGEWYEIRHKEGQWLGELLNSLGIETVEDFEEYTKASAPLA